MADDPKAGETSVVPAATPAPPATPDASQMVEDKHREALVAAVSDGTVGKLPPLDPAPAPEPAPKPPEVEAPLAGPPATEPAPELDDDLVEPELTEDDLRHMERVKHAFASVRGKLRSAKEAAQFGSLIKRMGESAGVPPEVLANWVDLGARLNVGDASALDDLGRILGPQKLRISKMDEAPPPPPAPATPPPPAPADRFKTLAETLYNEEFKAEVDSFALAEDLARAKAEKLARRLLASQPSPSPAPSAPSQPIPVQQPPPAPQAVGPSPLEQAAMAEVAATLDRYATKIPKFREEVLPEVTKVIQQQRATSKTPPNPLRFVAEVQDAIRQVQAARAAKAQPKPAATPTGLQPTTIAKPQSAKAPDAMRQELLEKIQNGTLLS